MQGKLGREMRKQFLMQWVIIHERIMEKELVEFSHGCGTKFNLDITFFGEIQLKIDRTKRRDAYADNMGSLIPGDFREESRKEI